MLIFMLHHSLNSQSYRRRTDTAGAHGPQDPAVDGAEHESTYVKNKPTQFVDRYSKGFGFVALLLVELRS